MSAHAARRHENEEDGIGIEWDSPDTIRESLFRIQLAHAPEDPRDRLSSPQSGLQAVEFCTAKGKRKTGFIVAEKTITVKNRRIRQRVQRIRIWCPKHDTFFTRDPQQVRFISK